MKIDIEIPDDELTKAIYKAIKEQEIGKIIAEKMIMETAKTNKEGYFADAIDIYDSPFVESLLEDFGYKVDDKKEYHIRSLYKTPLRVVDVTEKVEREGKDYYFSDGGLRVLDYRFLGLHEEKSTMKESKAYKGIKEILEKGKIAVIIE